MAKFNASGLRLEMETTVSSTTSFKLFAHEATLGLDLSTATIDVTSKDNDGWEDVLGGLKSGDVSVDLFLDYDPPAGTLGFDEAFDAWDARLRPNFRLGTEETGTTRLLFKALITGFSVKGEKETGAQVSLKLKVANGITKGTVS